MPVVSLTARRRLALGGFATGALVAAIVAGSLVVPAAVAAKPLLDPGVQARATKVPSKAYAILKAIPTGIYPWAIAVNDADNTVFITNGGSNSVSIVDGDTGTVRGTVAVGSFPWGVAVNQRTGTVYVANAGSNTVSILDARTGNVTSTVSVGESPQGVAVNNATGSVYVVNSESNSVSVIDGRTGKVSSTVSVAGAPFGVSVNQTTGTVYVVGAAAGNVPTISAPGFIAVIDGQSGALVRQVAFGVGPWSVAVHDADDRLYVNDTWLQAVSAFNGPNANTWVSAGGAYWAVAVDQATGAAYVTDASIGAGVSTGLVKIFGASGNLTSSINLAIAAGQPAGPSRGVAIDQAGANAGIAYIAATDSSTVYAVARTSANSAPTSGTAGDTVRITLSVPNLSRSLSMDDSTVASVSFGEVAGTLLTAGAANTWTVQAPRGKGSVPVVVTFNGGQRAVAGTFSYGASTTR